MNDLVYKILTPEQWQDFARAGQFDGSEHDKQDGFIHLCKGSQLQGTLDKHYAEINQVYLVGFMGKALGPNLKWEVSRGGEKFPHLYATLPFSALVNADWLAQTPDGGFVLPRDI